MSGKPAHLLTPEEEVIITESLDELDFTGEQRMCGRLLFALVFCGTTNPDKLAKAAGLNRDFCRLVCKRLRKNGVIEGRRTLRVEWFSDDAGISEVSFIADTLVAQGAVVRSQTEDGQIIFDLDPSFRSALNENPELLEAP